MKMLVTFVRSMRRNIKKNAMKTHLQKTRTQNGKVVKYSIPECGKRGSSNVFLRMATLETFKNISETDRKRCCVYCLAKLK
jgi:hypothetical protein